MKDDCDRALELAQTIAREAVNRITEEAGPDGARGDATAIAVFGYLTGVGDRILEVRGEAPPVALLFTIARSLGRGFAASDTDIIETLENDK